MWSWKTKSSQKNLSRCKRLFWRFNLPSMSNALSPNTSSFFLTSRGSGSPLHGLRKKAVEVMRACVRLQRLQNSQDQRNPNHNSRTFGPQCHNPCSKIVSSLPPPIKHGRMFSALHVLRDVRHVFFFFSILIFKFYLWPSPEELLRGWKWLHGDDNVTHAAVSPLGPRMRNDFGARGTVADVDLRGIRGESIISEKDLGSCCRGAVFSHS